MMKRASIISVLSLLAVWGISAPAEACGWPYNCDFGMPSPYACFCAGFFSLDSHLGLGPGFPGLYPLSPALAVPNPYPSGFFPLCSLRPGPQVVVITIPLLQRDERAAAQELQSAQPAPVYPGPPQSAIAGPKSKTPLPAVEKDGSSRHSNDAYTPSRYYQGRLYTISRTDALGKNPGPGIIVWTPPK